MAESQPAASSPCVLHRFPRDVVAQPLERLREPFDSPDWLFELKYDGFRGLAYLADGDGTLVSRAGNVMRAGSAAWLTSWRRCCVGTA